MKTTWARLIYDGIHEVEVLAVADTIAIVRKIEDGKTVATFPANLFASKDDAIKDEIEQLESVAGAIKRSISDTNRDIGDLKIRMARQEGEQRRCKKRIQLLRAGKYKEARIPQ